MILVISPAKSLDFSKIGVTKHTQPRMLQHSDILVKTLRRKSSDDLRNLMKVSENIATLNVARYKSYATPFTLDNSKQALFAFTGDVYRGLDVSSLESEDLDFANQHLRILSGLYGVLKPLDLIQPYRLEMGTKLKNKRGKNLYEFWNTRISRILNEDLEAQDDNILINLASNEYFKSIKLKNLKLSAHHFSTFCLII